MTLDGLIKKFNPVNVRPAIVRALSYTGIEYGNILRRQLLRGKGSDGNDLTPGYLQDPYFKSPASALRYAQWKFKNSPSEGRNFNAPNLFITGYFHKSLLVFVGLDGLTIDSTTAFGEDIDKKYRGKATVLGGEYRQEFLQKQLRPEVLKELNL